MYLPLNENKEPKIKRVHFMNEAALRKKKNKNQKSPMNKGKSNLKKTKKDPSGPFARRDLFCHAASSGTAAARSMSWMLTA